MKLNKRLQFKVNEIDENAIKQRADMYRMPLSTYLRLKVLDNEILQEKQAG
jgi:predicted DNA binding CopG/RHH family protein